MKQYKVWTHYDVYPVIVTAPDAVTAVQQGLQQNVDVKVLSHQSMGEVFRPAKPLDKPYARVHNAKGK